ILSILIGYYLFGNNSISEGMNRVEGLETNEAVQNIASIYNTDKMSITELNVTGGKLGIGNEKFMLHGVGQDDYLRLYNACGTGYYGGIAANKFYDVGLNGTIKDAIQGLDARIKALESNTLKKGEKYNLIPRDSTSPNGNNRPVGLGLNNILQTKIEGTLFGGLGGKFSLEDPPKK
ncbi:MAG: hypothetical protein ACFFKA_06685, partial [Candidatus Thorarchaeota archaeon]